MITKEELRLHDERERGIPWRRWGGCRWNDEGLGAICDDRQRLWFAVALGNGFDQARKEQVCSCLDSTPTHSYMKYFLKCAPPPDSEAAAGPADRRCFDVFVEYAKSSPEDILVLITVCNRGPDASQLHVYPTLSFRNAGWSGSRPRPVLQGVSGSDGVVVVASHPEMGDRYLYCGRNVPLLFTNSEANPVCGAHRQQAGTRASAHYALDLPAGGSEELRLRLSDRPPGRAERRRSDPVGAGFDAVLAQRRRDADEFYESVIPASLDADDRHVMRQALAGLLWCTAR